MNVQNHVYTRSDKPKVRYSTADPMIHRIGGPEGYSDEEKEDRKRDLPPEYEENEKCVMDLSFASDTEEKGLKLCK